MVAVPAKDKLAVMVFADFLLNLPVKVMAVLSSLNVEADNSKAMVGGKSSEVIVRLTVKRRT